MKLPRDPASLQAMRYITLFDEALKKRGVQVLIGGELEFYAETRARDRNTLANNINSAFINSHRHIRNQLACDNSDSLYALPGSVRSGPVALFYEEYPNRQYEITTIKGKPLRSAHRIAALRKFLGECNTYTSLSSHGLDILKLLENIRFDANIPNQMENGMHVNISLNAIHLGPRNSYVSLMTPVQHSPEVSPVMEHLKQKLWELNATDSALLLSGPAALKRLDSRWPLHRVQSGTMDKPDGYVVGDPYIEYNMPAADSNPYFAILMLKAAAYNMLKDLPVRDANMPPLTPEELQRFSKERKHGEFQSTGLYEYSNLPTTLEEADERFQKSSIVAGAMREVAIESGLSAPQADQQIGAFKYNVSRLRSAGKAIGAAL